MFNPKNAAVFLAALLAVLALLIYGGRPAREIGGGSEMSGGAAAPVESGEKKVPESFLENQSCVKEERVVEARGTSLLPMISAGEELTLLVGYYNCNEPRRGDLVAYDYAGNLDPIAKIIKAAPGDKWELLEEGGGAAILVNGEILRNSGGERYFLPPERVGMLRLYAKDYPVIPADTYLILGDNSGGTLDASRFGLVAKKDIIGKLEIKR